MIVLAIDTAGVDCSVAVYDAVSDRFLARAQETLGKGHAERLSGMIDEVMSKAGLAPADLGVVAGRVGPAAVLEIGDDRPRPRLVARHLHAGPGPEGRAPA